MSSIFKVGDKVWNFPRAWGEILKFDEEDKLFNVRFKTVPQMTFFFNEEGKEVTQLWQYAFKRKNSKEFEISACDYSTDHDFLEINSEIEFSEFNKIITSKKIGYPEDIFHFSNTIEREINLEKIFNYTKEVLEYINLKTSVLSACKKLSEKEENVLIIKTEISNLTKISEIMLGNEIKYDLTKIRARQNMKSLYNNTNIRL